MQVSVILQKKGSTEVATILPTATLAEAIAQLAARHFGALVVSSTERKIDGIISERDIVARLGTAGADALKTLVQDAMTTKVECAVAADTALDVLGRMTEGRFRHMPVQGPDGRMIGILSIGDVVKARLEEIEAENSAMADMLSG